MGRGSRTRAARLSALSGPFCSAKQKPGASAAVNAAKCRGPMLAITNRLAFGARELSQGKARQGKGSVLCVCACA